LFRIEPLTDQYLSGALAVANNFVGSGRKRCCGFIPLAWFPTTLTEFKQLFQTENAKSASAVAIRQEDDVVVGFVHMTDITMKRDTVSSWLHTSHPGECYIEMMCVLDEAQGQGIGTRLLQFCEDTAKERQAKTLCLGVVDKNPAKRLYQRFGFVDKQQQDDYLATLLVVCCLFGCPHGGWGATDMVKDLSNTDPSVTTTTTVQQ
jgi:ribosomal protein S18 acetylase RimI-like enzyme